MIEQSNGDVPGPLPEDWLPESTAAEGAPEWQSRVERIVAAAEPALRKLGEWGSRSEVTWSTILGPWWKPAAAMSLAAAVVLFILGPPETAREPGNRWLPLSVVAAEGEPFALWQGLGIEADPVLALIALQAEGR